MEGETVAIYYARAHTHTSLDTYQSFEKLKEDMTSILGNYNQQLYSFPLFINKEQQTQRPCLFGGIIIPGLLPY